MLVDVIDGLDRWWRNGWMDGCMDGCMDAWMDVLDVHGDEEMRAIMNTTTDIMMTMMISMML